MEIWRRRVSCILWRLPNVTAWQRRSKRNLVPGLLSGLKSYQIGVFCYETFDFWRLVLYFYFPSPFWAIKHCSMRYAIQAGVRIPAFLRRGKKPRKKKASGIRFLVPATFPLFRFNRVESGRRRLGTAGGGIIASVFDFCRASFIIRSTFKDTLRPWTGLG
ncbi:hypothetical protein VTN77DRAFT_814 [Rasamsonia byssochlamydoides]|uniref:uncharacterized protein n=1 Tax=Rasamsonia byssochlamydoides TaxID=89139 RepID=UPI0037435BE3